MTRNALGFKKPNLITKDTILDFGQYKGMSVKEIMEFDAPYLIWVVENVEHFVIDDAILMDEIIICADYRDILLDTYDLYNPLSHL